ncbi:MAG: M14 family metallopeptidase [Chitinophagaceae bacterium]
MKIKLRFAFIALLFITKSNAQPPQTKFELSDGKQSPAYSEIIDWWKKMDAASPFVKMEEKGMTDAGFPLHLVLVSADKDFDIASIKKKKKTIILINNGIHPGEPDGIDASMLLAKDMATGKYKLPADIVFAIIPVYNIGGCLNRSADYRVDQNGPEEFGFRGNSQNLDLNRDFIKCDSKDARAFAEIFHLLDPDIFVDNHVSDGADYQHVMTLLTTQNTKLGGVLGEDLANQFEPALYDLMKKKGYDLVPYVNAFGDTPENGWTEYWDSPRYSSGYAVLWNTFSFVPETHMLKPYKQRVESTKALMESFIEFASKNGTKIRELREQSRQAQITQPAFPIRWALDRSKYKEVLYKGYAAGNKPSEVSGLSRLYYDRSKPFEKMVKVYNYYPPKEYVNKPKAYIIPQGWWKVIDLLKLNKVQLSQFKTDTTIEVEMYHIDDYKTQARQFEMHHLNYDVKVSARTTLMKFRKGDYYIPMNQVANRFLVETLEPQGEDSYFAWNYFDAILGQKEGYSGYAFEDIAADYLKKNPELKAKLAQRVAADTAFARNGRAQLNFVYEQSPWFEPAYLQYPVYRVVK